MREQRKQIAQETLKIVQQGFYTTGNTHITISDAFWRSEYHSYLLTPDEGHNLVQSVNKTLNNIMTSYYTSYKVINASAVKVIIDAHKLEKPIAALNFASAKNPGGGFLNGAMAQEEALSYASNLYSTQLRHMNYYEANRACGTAMYTDHAIYSPDVIFFRDENNTLVERSVKCSVLTLPAVNMGQVRSRGECVDLAKKTMKDRMRLALAVFAKEGNSTIILGAFGCGVFQNDPNDIAQWWHELLVREGYGAYFHNVLFAVMDKPSGENIRAFERVF